MDHTPESHAQEMYREAIREQTIRLLQIDPDWQTFRNIQDTSERLIQEEKDSYRDNYAARVDKARQDLLHKAGSKTLDHPVPPGMGQDRFHADRINREARKVVMHEHAQKLFAIRETEIRAYETLGEHICTRGQSKGIARDAFARATDRRDGQDRRAPSPNR